MPEEPSPNAPPPDDVPIWAQPDPWRDEHGELPVDEVHHRDRVDAAIETIRDGWPMLIIPAALVMLLLSLLVGDAVWKLIWVFPFLYMLAIVATPLMARLRKGGEVRLPGAAALTGPDKRKTLVAALGLSALLAAYAVYGGVWEYQLREWLKAMLAGAW